MCFLQGFLSDLLGAGGTSYQAAGAELDPWGSFRCLQMKLNFAEDFAENSQLSGLDHQWQQQQMELQQARGKSAGSNS